MLDVGKCSRYSYANLIEEKKYYISQFGKVEENAYNRDTLWPSNMSRNLNQRANQGCVPRLATGMHSIASHSENLENKIKHNILDQ